MGRLVLGIFRREEHRRHALLAGFLLNTITSMIVASTATNGIAKITANPPNRHVTAATENSRVSVSPQLTAFSFRWDLILLERAVGMEPFVEPPG